MEKLQAAHDASFTRAGPAPILLHGLRGCGKSAVLQEVVYWARRNNWLVFNIKSGLLWIAGGSMLEKSTVFENCWDQPKVAVSMLSYFMDAHQDKLKEIKCRTEFTVGSFDSTEDKYFFFCVYAFADARTLFDLVEYGAALNEYASTVVYHLKKELERVIEYPVLIAIDDYNELYSYSQVYRNPDSQRFKPEKLRNRDLTLTRLFMDSHMYIDHQ